MKITAKLDRKHSRRHGAFALRPNWIPRRDRIKKRAEEKCLTPPTETVPSASEPTTAENYEYMEMDGELKKALAMLEPVKDYFKKKQENEPITPEKLDLRVVKTSAKELKLKWTVPKLPGQNNLI